MWLAHETYESLITEKARLEGKVEYLDLENSSLKAENQKLLDTLAGLATRRTHQDLKGIDPLTDPFAETEAVPTVWLSDETPDVRALKEAIEDRG